MGILGFPASSTVPHPTLAGSCLFLQRAPQSFLTIYTAKIWKMRTQVKGHQSQRILYHDLKCPVEESGSIILSPVCYCRVFRHILCANKENQPLKMPPRPPGREESPYS